MFIPGLYPLDAGRNPAASVRQPDIANVSEGAKSTLKLIDIECNKDNKVGGGFYIEQYIRNEYLLFVFLTEFPSWFLCN